VSGANGAVALVGLIGHKNAVAKRLWPVRAVCESHYDGSPSLPDVSRTMHKYLLIFACQPVVSWLATSTNVTIVSSLQGSIPFSAVDFGSGSGKSEIWPFFGNPVKSASGQISSRIWQMPVLQCG